MPDLEQLFKPASGTVTTTAAQVEDGFLPSSTTDDDAEVNRDIRIAKRRRLFSRANLHTTINPQYADLVFLLCYFLSGLCDASAYRAWGCFVGMQTGNTIFVGLGASAPAGANSDYKWLKALVSITSFLVGSRAFNSAAQMAGARKRITLMASFSVQAILLIISALLLELSLISGKASPTGQDFVGRVSGSIKDSPFLQLIPLAMVALQSAGQMAASRALAFTEIPTTVLTSLYYDLASDPALGAGWSENVKRNRRSAAVVAVVAGAVAGGWMGRAIGGISVGLWITAGCKILIVCAWFVWNDSDTV
ncbi:hypothetical protein FQN57_002504 [Myotisia sp. PD_48]|nr:hypothetical protein FQN57_002504 [Myotisia sp. PD_48]